ncbi:flavin-containing monooxygenase [Bradyrhizobium mercantei]|uniref:flavin-containing monooxygenase n=1 Tax=Bradyrhizobium mercantei TaxID=1904807 RepID=UPI0009775A84|nr:NAD(P)/FAD-dependent oxidoreductase [Bradyrhizobium mercantei]
MKKSDTTAGFEWGGLLPEPTVIPDTAEVRRKYSEERAKRLASNRTDISDLTGELAHYLDDPYSVAVERAALNDEVDALVVGAGFGGLMTAARLKEAGLASVRVVDSAGDVGGTWYWNRYPGIMCDVESYIYLPLLEETGYIPTEKYASGSEIFEYSKQIARHYGLYPLALFHTTVKEVRWDADAARWVVRTDRGDAIRARYVAICKGIFNNPRLPGIPGLGSFKGRSFHSSRWDYAYTAGDITGGLTGLSDKRVGVVGTGATAVQVLPQVARHALATYLFQRTPSTVGPRNNRPTDASFAAGLEPGWQRRRMANFTEIISGRAQSTDLVDDGWTAFYGPLRRSLASFGQTPEEALAAKERLDLKQMEAIRARVDHVVKDPETAERLKPYYNYHCKRPAFHDDYLEAFNRSTVTLVDTDGQGIEEVLPDGVVAGGRKYELDCLIFATGFDYESNSILKGIEIKGRDGSSLSDKWNSGIATLHGMTSRGFPNLFILPGSNAQAALTVNFSHTIQEHAAHIGYIVREMESRGVRFFDVSRRAEQEWVQRIAAGVDRRPAEVCTPGRLTNEGQLDKRPIANANFPDAMGFFRVLSDWREDGTLSGLELNYGQDTVQGDASGTGSRATAEMPSA